MIRTNRTKTVNTTRTSKRVFKLGIVVLLFAVVLIITICLSSLLSNTLSEKGFVVLSPKDYQMFQRDWETNSGVIPISVDAFGFGEKLDLDVKWQDNNWYSVQLSRTKNQCDGSIKSFSFANPHAICFNYMGFIADLPAGQSTLALRLSGWHQPLLLPDAQASVQYVGIGDVFLLAGQSNSVGDANNFQFYQSDHYVSTVFSRTGRWMELDDKVLTDQRPLIYNMPIKGSPWPLLGTLITQYTNAPVAFIPTGIGGEPIKRWGKNGNLYNFMVQQIQLSGTQPAIILWIQGEAEALAKMPTETYKNALDALVQRVNSELHLRMMIANLGVLERPEISEADVENIRRAIETIWKDNPLAIPGPTLADIPLQANPHFTTDEEIKQFAQRWFESLKAAGLPRGSQVN